MQKRLYVAQLIHLGRYGDSLFADPIEAWNFGPVVPTLYRKLRPFGRSRVTELDADPFEPATTGQLAVHEAWTLTHHLTSGEMVTLTHRPLGAWDRARQAGSRSISLDAMRQDWRDIFEPSAPTMAWARQMAAQVEASPSRYLDGARERAFRASLLERHL
jgi:uncharacterized phage-associated protein